jgi:hypothetical protein
LRMASTALGSISRLKCRVQRLFWAGKGTNRAQRDCS